jgi:hypothetical protein
MSLEPVSRIAACVLGHPGVTSCFGKDACSHDGWDQGIGLHNGSDRVGYVGRVHSVHDHVFGGYLEKEHRSPHRQKRSAEDVEFINLEM